MINCVRNVVGFQKNGELNQCVDPGERASWVGTKGTDKGEVGECWRAGGSVSRTTGFPERSLKMMTVSGGGGDCEVWKGREGGMPGQYGIQSPTLRQIVRGRTVAQEGRGSAQGVEGRGFISATFTPSLILSRKLCLLCNVSF